MNALLLFTSNNFYLTAFFVLIMGAIVGSFLNMFIYRYPIMLAHEWAREHASAPVKKEVFNLCFPRSHCPQCKKIVTWWMNIPILSFLFLRGKCFYCAKKIGKQYLLTETISAIATLIVFLHFSFSLQTLELLIFTYGLIALSFIDFNHRILPDIIVYLLLWLGLIVSTQAIFVDPTQAIFGAIAGYLFLWCIGQGYALLRKKEGMGLGDCKMLGMIGAWVGYTPLMNIVLLSAVLALVTTLLLLIQKKIHPQSLIPFGPFIAIAGWTTVIYGDFITLWISSWLM